MALMEEVAVAHASAAPVEEWGDDSRGTSPVDATLVTAMDSAVARWATADLAPNVLLATSLLFDTRRDAFPLPPLVAGAHVETQEHLFDLLVAEGWGRGGLAATSGAGAATDGGGDDGGEVHIIDLGARCQTGAFFNESDIVFLRRVAPHGLSVGVEIVKSFLLDLAARVRAHFPTQRDPITGFAAVWAFVGHGFEPPSFVHAYEGALDALLRTHCTHPIIEHIETALGVATHCHTIRARIASGEPGPVTSQATTVRSLDAIWKRGILARLAQRETARLGAAATGARGRRQLSATGELPALAAAAIADRDPVNWTLAETAAAAAYFAQSSGPFFIKVDYDPGPSKLLADFVLGARDIFAARGFSVMTLEIDAPAYHPLLPPLAAWAAGHGYATFLKWPCDAVPPGIRGRTGFVPIYGRYLESASTGGGDEGADTGPRYVRLPLDRRMPHDLVLVDLRDARVLRALNRGNAECGFAPLPHPAALLRHYMEAEAAPATTRKAQL